MASAEQASHFLTAEPLPDEAEARASFVLGLRRRGIGAHDVLSAIERVPRRLFLSARFHGLAYDDSNLPIECGQVVAAPSHVAHVVQALSIAKKHRILEIGTGSGYQSAILGHLAGRVDTVDRYQTLVSLAEQRIAALRLGNVFVHHNDGLSGLTQKAPFDRIILNGAVESISEEILGQLAPEAILIAPIGAAGEPQDLVKLSRINGQITKVKIGVVRSVALTAGKAQSL
ncbi:protein-L-isoaspartate O-methyltransferase [Roseibium sp. TrichSKD4]|uniref:protein-L-isoaspartate(D-aspartate) O-methyltransferase n=1 Tax=Roseibium sp. TrichSKD4 TaxID=744980 RepID=UPI0001E5734F|nr:protein-L-isoaspartate(D-aspartate) O-methyltransferase [Roseibium sp. TrichSKD4]EFO29769.1 protein-L-isoaspartate O-methyltransferase [Roseibium sp. TrichSKD4]